MAAKKRKPAQIDHSPVAGLTLDDYARASGMVQAGRTQSEVCRLCGITGPQYWHMWRNGFPGRGRESLPSFEQVVAEQAVELRKAGQEAAHTVGIRGVRVLAKEVAAAEIANDIGLLLLRCQREKLQEWLAITGPRPPLAENLLGDEATRLLTALHKWSDLTRPAAAFGRLYDMSVLDVLAHKGDELPDPIDTDARERLPAALSSREEVAGGDAGRTFQLVEAAKTFEGWTEAEMRHFAETGEEPPGKG